MIGARGLRKHLEKIADSSVGNGVRADAQSRAGAAPERIGRYRFFACWARAEWVSGSCRGRESAAAVALQDHHARPCQRSNPATVRARGARAGPAAASEHRQIHEAGTFDLGNGAQPFFAMELVQGRPLLRYC